MSHSKSKSRKLISNQSSKDNTINFVRLVLIAVGILYTYGINAHSKSLGFMVLSFAVPAFYIISGYLVLHESKNIEKRILRAIGRTAICFVILAVAYFLMSLLADYYGTLALVSSKSFWVNVFIFNVWPLSIGSVIWYVLAMLYAYIGIFIIYKLRLIKFDIVIAVLCLIFAALAGEWANIIDFRFLAYTYLGGNFLTRALPYILIGSFISRKEDTFSTLTAINCLQMAAIGLILSFIEYLWLSLMTKNVYPGHMVGTSLVAVAVACYTLFRCKISIKSPYLGILTRHELFIPFYICSPIYFLLTGAFGVYLSRTFGTFIDFAGFITLFLSYLVFFVYVVIRRVIYDHTK